MARDKPNMMMKSIIKENNEVVCYICHDSRFILAKVRGHH
jgi:hypothetical protein